MRLTRMCVIGLIAGVLSVASAQVCAATEWQRGLGQPGADQKIERTGQVSPGVLRPNLPAGVNGEKGSGTGQYFDYGRFFSYLYANYKFFFGPS